MIAILQLFGFIALGMLLSHCVSDRYIQTAPAFWNKLAQVTYLVFTTALMFDVLSRFEWEKGYTLFIVSTILGIVIAIVFALKLISGDNIQGLTAQAISFQPNCVFLGFPLIATVLNTHPQALAYAAIFAATEVTISTMAAIYILRREHTANNSSQLRLLRFAADTITITLTTLVSSITLTVGACLLMHHLHL